MTECDVYDILALYGLKPVGIKRFVNQFERQLIGSPVLNGFWKIEKIGNDLESGSPQPKYFDPLVIGNLYAKIVPNNSGTLAAGYRLSASFYALDSPVSLAGLWGTFVTELFQFSDTHLKLDQPFQLNAPVPVFGNNIQLITAYTGGTISNSIYFSFDGFVVYFK